MDYNKILAFWNNAYNYDFKYDDGAEFTELGTKVMEEELKKLKGKVLDLGCGSGWASFYLGSVNKDVTVVAMDHAENAIKHCEYVKNNLHLDSVNFVVSNDDTLSKMKADSFDALVSVNVLDVIPVEVTKEILKDVNRICKNKATILFSFNPYADKELQKTLKMEDLGDHYLGRDGNVRCYNMTNDEWLDLFKPYFRLVEIKNYKFDQEPEFYIRRLFVLENNK